MTDDPKNPDDIFRSAIKQFVATTNNILGALEETSKPVGAAWDSIKIHSVAAKDSAIYAYQRRHEFPLEIIGGTATLGGGIAWWRRGRIAGVLSAAVCGGAAYAIVYDEIKLQEIPDMVFGKKE
jgi:hypothetical protein